MLAASPGSLQSPEKISEECRSPKANGTGGEINGQKAVVLAGLPSATEIGATAGLGVLCRDCPAAKRQHGI
jgi:hypothetical protein